jgi:ATP-binding cassette subfamily B protein
MAFVDTVQNVHFIRETLHQVGRPHEVSDPPGARDLPVGSGTVRLSRLSFHYPTGERVIDDVSIDIPAGQKVGIVGASGAGKSTLVSLIQRLHDVQGGEIVVDGHRVQDVTQDSLRAALGVVPQEVTLFHRSILDNIRVARPDASDDEVVAAARASRCDGFIRRLRDGYATFVGERGTKLSGGQRQRIGIARVFLKDPPVVLLDEATSALDTQTEQQIQETIDVLMRNRTVIAVAHRLSTLANFDRVVVLENGRVVEDGHPAALIAKPDGRFAAMWRRQQGNRQLGRMREETAA